MLNMCNSNNTADWLQFSNPSTNMKSVQCQYSEKNIIFYIMTRLAEEDNRAISKKKIMPNRIYVPFLTPR